MIRPLSQLPRRPPANLPPRNPTLSYTARLEKRVKELEAQLAIASSASPAGPSSATDAYESSPSPSRSDSATPDTLPLDPGYEDFVCESFKGLKVDDNGSITYHGTTSFFQLPDDRRPGFRGLASSSNQATQRRERLVANAWQQRALENLSDIPVSHHEQSGISSPFLTNPFTGAFPVSPKPTLVVDPAHVQFHLQTRLHP